MKLQKKDQTSTPNKHTPSLTPLSVHQIRLLEQHRHDFAQHVFANVQSPHCRITVLIAVTKQLQKPAMKVLRAFHALRVHTLVKIHRIRYAYHVYLEEQQINTVKHPATHAHPENMQTSQKPKLVTNAKWGNMETSK